MTILLLIIFFLAVFLFSLRYMNSRKMTVGEYIMEKQRAVIMLAAKLGYGPSFRISDNPSAPTLGDLSHRAYISWEKEIEAAHIWLQELDNQMKELSK